MRVTVVGSGFVGATAAMRVVQKGLAEVVLIDIIEGLPQGIALDIRESSPVEGFEPRITGTNDYADTAGSDVVVITAGLPRQPGMSRMDLLEKNAGIVRGVVEQVREGSPEAILIVVTNPLDEMTYLAAEVSGFSRQRVMGPAAPAGHRGGQAPGRAGGRGDPGAPVPADPRRRGGDRGAAQEGERL